MNEKRVKEIKQAIEERSLLKEICMITSKQFAEKAAEKLESAKTHDFKKYLKTLDKMIRLLLYGVDEEFTLDAVSKGTEIEKILIDWKEHNE